MDEIYIGIVDCGKSDESRSLAEACLSAEERERHERLRQPLSRRCFVEGRRLARQMLGRLAACDPASLHISIDDEGKPTFQARPDWHFNISHSGTLAACVVSRQPVGMDLEFHKPGKSRLEVADRFFSPAEVAEIEHSGDHLERFYHYWTLKEAWLKWQGWGLSGLSRVPVYAFRPDGSIILLDSPQPKDSPGPASLAVWNLALAESGGIWTMAIAAGSPWKLVEDPVLRLETAPATQAVHRSPEVNLQALGKFSGSEKPGP